MRDAASAGQRAFSQSFIGQTLRVLWESDRQGPEGTVWSGLTDNYVRVTTRSSENLANRLLPTRMVGLYGNDLLGEIETEKRGMG
jgi:tRNA A37 methylthiotransferase MiaB